LSSFNGRGKKLANSAKYQHTYPKEMIVFCQKCHYSRNSKNTIISFWGIDFWPKTFIIPNFKEKVFADLKLGN